MARGLTAFVDVAMLRELCHALLLSLLSSGLASPAWRLVSGSLAPLVELPELHRDPQ